MPHVVNDFFRSMVPLVGIWQFVLTSGCHIAQSTNHPTIVADLSESSAMADELNQEGIKLVQTKQFSKAEARFEDAIRADPSFGPGYNNLGLVFYHQHDFFEAARAFEAASEFMPDNPEPLNNLGLVMETVARPDDAIELYQKASRMAPTNAEYLGNLLRARVRLNQIDDELLSQLHALLLYEKRTEWQDWAREQLSLLHNPNLDRGPATPSTSSLNSLINQSSDSPDSNKPRSLSLPSEYPPLPKRSLVVPENDLRLPSSPSEGNFNSEKLPSIPPPSSDPASMSPLPPIPYPKSPVPVPSNSYPLTLPPPSRFPTSILEPLE